MGRDQIDDNLDSMAERRQKFRDEIGLDEGDHEETPSGTSKDSEDTEEKRIHSRKNRIRMKIN